MGCGKLHSKDDRSVSWIRHFFDLTIDAMAMRIGKHLAEIRMKKQQSSRCSSSSRRRSGSLSCKLKISWNTSSSTRPSLLAIAKCCICTSSLAQTSPSPMFLHAEYSIKFRVLWTGRQITPSPFAWSSCPVRRLVSREIESRLFFEFLLVLFCLWLTASALHFETTPSTEKCICKSSKCCSWTSSDLFDSGTSNAD